MLNSKEVIYKRKVIFTAAITGSMHIPSQSPFLPITPDQIAENAIQAYLAGAAVVHIHVRNPETGQPSADKELFRNVLTRIKGKCNVIVCISTGGGLGMTPAQRVSAVSTFHPELASFNMGSMNIALFHHLSRFPKFEFSWEEEYLKSTEDLIFPNTFKSMKEFLQIFDGAGTKPELEIYDAGMINNTAYMIEQGLLRTPVYLQFVLGLMGGMPASIKNLMFLHETACQKIGEKNFVWSVCAAGRNQMPMCTAGMLMGGNARVGLEDALYLEHGNLAKNNAELIKKIIRIARDFDLEPATPNEARTILQMKGIDKVGF